MSLRRSVVALALSSLASCSSLELYCAPAMLTSELDGTLRVRIPPKKGDEFNRRVVAFLKTKGFSYETSASNDWLTPPDASGRQAVFRNIKTIGCTYRAVVWSANSIHPDEFVITFYHTALGDRNSTQKLLTELAATIRPARTS